MPRVIHTRLTVRGVATVSKPGAYADGLGLYLQVAKAGQKSWVLRYMFAGRRRNMGLGSTRIVSLADARTTAQEAQALLRKLIDPIEARNEKRAALTHAVQVRRVKFEEALDQYLRYKDLKGKHATNVANPMYTYIVPVLGKLPVEDITPRLVVDALITKAKSGSAFWDLTLGSRYLPYLAGVFAYAIHQGWRENPINPADREQLAMSGLKSQTREVVHFPACPYSRIPECWERLSAHTDTAMMSLRWAVLNAARPKEARRLRWDWIDTSNRVVTIPGAEMKGGREHRIPYSAASAVLLEIMREVRTCDWVFPNPQNQPYSADLFAKLPRQVMPEVKGITAHGFRSSFADWAGERTVFEPDMIEIALAHQVGDKVVAAYRRGDLLEKRRTMMEAWAEYCQGHGTATAYRSAFGVVA